MTPKQRHAQIGRIHAAAKSLGFDQTRYREFLEVLTGQRSCSEMTDRQINHAMDWFAWLTGRRNARPRSFCKDGGSVKNMARMAYALADVKPEGWQEPPLSSPGWLQRMTGRVETAYEAYSEDELYILIEGLKAICRRTYTPFFPPMA